MFKGKTRTSKLLQSLGILLVLSCCAFTQERTWKTFSPDNGDWSILAPGILKPDPEALESPSTKGSYSYSDSNGFFAVIYRDSPKRVVPWKPNYKAYYRKVRDRFVKGAKGELLKDEEFTNGSVVGREIHIKMQNDRVVNRESGIKTTYRIERFRMFFHGRRFYLLLAILPEEEIDTSTIDNYLNSFVAK
jgi:hypothetical protein